MQARTTHLVTTFDSGGSSGRLRAAFDMPAVGDLRRRALSLADLEDASRAAFVQVLDHRFPIDATPAALRRAVASLARGTSPLQVRLAPSDRARLSRAIDSLLDHPRARALDLAGASVGNLALAGLYLERGRRLGPAVSDFARWVGARGEVRPISEVPLHIAVELENGRSFVGQHLLTGKEAPPIESPVRRIHLCRGPDEPAPVRVHVDPAVRDAILAADLVCYPIGSFYSSVVVNLLPAGTAEAIALSPARKVYIHNLGRDPEQLGRSCFECAMILLGRLRRDPLLHHAASVLDTVVVDAAEAHRIRPEEQDRFAELGIELVALPLAGGAACGMDPARLAAALEAFAAPRVGFAR